MPPAWILVLKGARGDPQRRVGGLSLLLRLALDAQRAHARAIVLTGPMAAHRSALVDRRLTIPILEQIPGACLAVEVPADTLLHRQSFTLLELEGHGTGPISALEQLTRFHQRATREVPFWFDPIAVVDDATARTAEHRLFRALRKREDGWTSRWLNRYVSLAISRYLAKTSLHPNQLSVAILAVGLFGAWLASRGSYAAMLLGAFLFQMQSILDGCDGELSRVTYRGSYLGEWFDTVGDDLTNYAFFVGSAVGLYRQTSQPLFLGVGGVMLFCGVLASGIEYRYLLSIHSGDLLKYPLSQATSDQTGRLGFIAPLFKRDTFVFLTLLAAAANVLGVALVAFSIAAVGVLASVLLTELRLYRERKAT